MAEPVFVPRPGQIDYTHIRRAPVINCIVRYRNKILLLKRSEELRLYPGMWSGLSGFLDDEKGPEGKAREELREELGMDESHIIGIHLGKVFEQEAPEYHKTWIVHPVLIEVDTDEISLDWENEQFLWVAPERVSSFNVIPDFEKVLHSVALL